jgi:hypothetical protein
VGGASDFGGDCRLNGVDSRKLPTACIVTLAETLNR